VGLVVSDLNKDELRQLADQHRDRIKSGVVAIGSIDKTARASLVVAVTKDLVSVAHAGNIVKEVAAKLGARGGGRADFAEAGSPSPDFARNAVAEARRLAEIALG
jgi:alanyl-tRNA synthetase